MALELQRQPSRKSCGPTTVAMLVGVPVAQVLALQPSVRMTPRRQRIREHDTNVGELRRLLAHFGYQLGPRCLGTVAPLTVLRLDHVASRGWHWAAQEGTWVYDPCLREPVHICEYHTVLERPADDVSERLSWYPVARPGEWLRPGIYRRAGQVIGRYRLPRAS